MRPTFGEIYMRFALSMAERSTCLRGLKVGTVITSTDNRKVYAVGYNGNATGLPNQCDLTGPEAVGNCGCFVSGTTVSATNVQRAYRRRYVGKVLRIVTRNNDFTVTPNHPVLALGRGLIPVQTLAEGDYVFRMERSQNETSSAPHSYNSVPIEQIFEAISVTGRLIRRSGTRHDFHNDGIPDEDIDIVTTDCDLRSDRKTCLGELLEQPSLPGPFQETSSLREQSPVFGAVKGRDGSLSSRSFLDPLNEPSFLETVFDHNSPQTQRSGYGSRGLSGAIPGEDLLLRNLEHGFSFIPAQVLSHLAQNSLLTEALLNGRVRNLKGLSDIENLFASQVALDQISHIERDSRTTHVYNLQTASGWYSAGSGNIIAQNCLHSEENAVINCDIPRETPKVVFCTHLPCKMCSKRLINLGGVQQVWYLNDYRIRDSLQLFDRCGIRASQFKFRNAEDEGPKVENISDATQKELERGIP